MDGVMAAFAAHLCGALDQVLDLDAGLADARLSDLHRALTQVLDLDLETGLAHIVPSASTSGPASTRGLNGLAHDLANRPLKDRLLARNRFPFREMLYLRFVAELVDKKLQKNSVPVSEIAQARTQALTLSRPASRSVSLVLRKALAELEECDGDCRAPFIDFVLDAVLGFTLNLVGDKELRRALAEQYDIQSSPRTIVKAVDRVIEAVTSVAGADLRHEDLHGVPLEGLRWSRSTRWPSDWEVYIVENSVEIEPGLFEIRFGDVDATV